MSSFDKWMREHNRQEEETIKQNRQSEDDFQAVRTEDIRRIWRWLAFTVLILVFGLVYENFSFGVYSNFMIYAFVFPLLMGLIPALFSALKGNRRQSVITWQLWNSAVMTFTVGSLMQGVLDIYGTTSYLMIVYWIAGIILTAGSLIIKPVLYGLKWPALHTGRTHSKSRKILR